MEIKLFDSELKVMNVLWEKGELYAREIVEILSENTGWNRNTTYTLINRCIKKGAIERIEPNFLCRALVKKETIQEKETAELVEKIFDGSTDLLFASLLGSRGLSEKDIEKLQKIVDEMSE